MPVRWSCSLETGYVFLPPLTRAKAGLRLTVLRHNKKEITQFDIHAVIYSKGSTEVKQEPWSRPAALLCISHCLSFFMRITEYNSKITFSTICAVFEWFCLTKSLPFCCKLFFFSFKVAFTADLKESSHRMVSNTFPEGFSGCVSTRAVREDDLCSASGVQLVVHKCYWPRPRLRHILQHSLAQ